MTIELDVDAATEDRLAELSEKTQGDVHQQVAFAVEDLIQSKHQELRQAEAQQQAQGGAPVVED